MVDGDATAAVGEGTGRSHGDLPATTTLFLLSLASGKLVAAANSAHSCHPHHHVSCGSFFTSRSFNYSHGGFPSLDHTRFEGCSPSLMELSVPWSSQVVHQ
jgi:hypothetical protein